MKTLLRSFAVALLAALTVLATEAPLADAVERSDMPALRKLIAARSDVNVAQADGSTPLHWAAYNDDLEAARLLVKAGAQAATANRYGMSPLILAATSGNAAMVELLLSAGADANTTLPGGETALMTASRTGKLDAVQVLLRRGANVNAKETARGQTAIMWAAAEGHTAVVEALIAAGADWRVRLESGFTPLLFAVREGHSATVQAFLKAGANVNEVIEVPRNARRVRGAPSAGTSALHLAVGNAHYDLASLLLDQGADPNAIGPGYTVLHTLTWVRKPGGGDNDPAPQGSGRMTSLELAKKLVARGANVNARMTKKVSVGLTSLNTAGATPFLLAARTADAEYMKALASLGAGVNIPNNDGANAIIVAAGLGTRSPGEDAGTEPEVVEALQVALDLGVDINAVDNNGETAMHGAAYKNLPKAVEFLAAKGAKPEIWNKKNKYGWTPLTIAEGYRFGNFKPSVVTVAAFHRVMKAAGIPIPPPAKPTGGWTLSQ